MAGYNKIERKIAYLLTKFPGLKLGIKKIYQKINFFRYKKSYSKKSEYKINHFALEDRESYFGYYDKSPINKTNEYIIFQSTNSKTNEMPNPTIPVDLVLYNCKKNSYEVVGQSSTYNWQQGTKLMWINDYKFIYNDFDYEENQYVSRIYDVQNTETKTINSPIYDCYGEDFAISLNFERLNIARADYSYSNINKEIDWTNNSDDGLYFIDLKLNTTRMIFSIEDIIQLNFKDTMNGAKHKFNHIMISPNGERMMFMHRWFLKDGRRFDSLYTANIDGSEINLIADDDMVSHCFWYDNSHVFAYLRDKTYGDKYYKLDAISGKKERIGEGKIDKFGDGHPHCHNERIIFDTYPDKARMKSLFLYEPKTDELTKLGEFMESFSFYGETRCDLHPRFSFDGEKVFFDSVHEEKRGLYMIDISK